MAFVSMSTAVKEITAEDRRRVVEAIVIDSAPVLQRYSDGPRLAFRLSTNLATALG